MFKLNSGSVGKEFWLHNGILYCHKYGKPLPRDGTIPPSSNGDRRWCQCTRRSRTGSVVVISAIIWKPGLMGRRSYIYHGVVDPLNNPLSGPANMRIALNASLTTTALVAAGSITVTFVVREVLSHGKKRRLTSKKGYPLPPGPPPRWFWDNVVPTVGSDRPAQLLSMRSCSTIR